MSNFDHAAEATSTAMNSAGSAAKENEAYMGGLEAKTTALKASFEQLSQTVINSNLVKGALDIGKSIMDGLNTPLGATVTQITLVSGALAGLYGMLKMGHVFDTMKTGGSMIISGFSKLSSILGVMPGKLALIVAAVAAVAAVVDYFHVSYKEAMENVEELKADKEELYGSGTRYDQLISKQSELNELERQELDYLQKRVDLQDAMIKQAEDEAFEKFQSEQGVGKKTLNNQAFTWLAPAQEFLTTKDQAQLNDFANSIDLLSGKVIDGEIALENFHGEFQNIITDMQEDTDQMQEWKDKGYELSEPLEKQLQLANDYLDVWDKASKGELTAVEEFAVATAMAMEAVGISHEQAVQAADELAGSVLTDLDELGTAAEETEEPVDVKITTSAPEAKEEVDSLKGSIDGLEDKTVNITVAMNPRIPNAISTLKDTASGVATGLLSKGGEMFTGLGGSAEGTDNAPGGPTLVNELGPELISANGKAYVAGGGKPTVTDLPPGAIVLNAEDTKKAIRGSRGTNSSIPAYKNGSLTANALDKVVMGTSSSTLTAHRGTPNKNTIGLKTDIGHVAYISEAQRQAMGEYTWLELLKQQKGGVDGTPVKGKPTHGGGGGGKPTPTPVDIKKQTEAFKDQIKVLEHRLFLMEEEGASEADRIDLMKKIQEEIEKQKKWYYDHGEKENSKYIQDLEKQWWKYEDKIKDLYKEQAEIYDGLFGAVGDKAQEEIDALEQKKQQIQDQNSELQKQIELEKALDELARAKQQQVLVYKDGKMQYVQDADAVAAAQSKVDEIKNREAVDQQIADIDKQIEEWEKYKEAWDSVVSDYDKKQDLLLLKEKLGIDLEAENWQERLDNLQTYIDKYNELMVKGGAKDADLKARAYSMGISGLAIPDTANGIGATGTPTPASLMSTFSGGLKSLGQGVAISIQNFNPNLPGVTDGQGFADYLRKNFLGEVLRVAKA